MKIRYVSIIEIEVDVPKELEEEKEILEYIFENDLIPAPDSYFNGAEIGNIVQYELNNKWYEC